jgi:hypothetical protein
MYNVEPVEVIKDGKIPSQYAIPVSDIELSYAVCEHNFPDSVAITGASAFSPSYTIIASGSLSKYTPAYSDPAPRRDRSENDKTTGPSVQDANQLHDVEDSSNTLRPSPDM